MASGERERQYFEIPDTAAGRRLDQVLAEGFPQYSRARLQTWIRQGRVRLNGAVTENVRQRVQGGEQVELDDEAVADPSTQAWQPESIALDMVFEDADLLVVNKRAGMVVHPAAGNYQGTLVNALLAYDPSLEQLPRAGIVHRLDKDTSGLLVVARNLAAHHHLVRQLSARRVKRVYAAVVQGTMVAGGRVDLAIGRHPVQRKRMAVVSNGKEAVTHYQVEERFRGHTLLRLQLETGRTHQIRVHMAALRHPLVGDPVYGGRMRVPAGASETLLAVLRGFRRQALHAAQLGLVHPASDDEMEWQAPLPDDMQRLLQALRKDEDDYRRQLADT